MSYLVQPESTTVEQNITEQFILYIVTLQTHTHVARHKRLKLHSPYTQTQWEVKINIGGTKIMSYPVQREQNIE